MKRILRLLIPILLSLALSPLCSCGIPYHYNAHGFGNVRYYGDYNSPFEIDCFGDMKPFRDDFSCAGYDYFYSYDETGYCRNVLDRALYWFVYADDEAYRQAKAYCTGRCRCFGDEPPMEYGGYLFYDFYGARDKSESYHGDDYPTAFKRVVFHDQKRLVAFFGIYTNGKEADRLKETLADWSLFLDTYFSAWYPFD
ncbi:MAG: hypothetical protein J6125_00830 [Clostridia bacterium]|nr:hypothetical protein [Clostridia bacterium]